MKMEYTMKSDTSPGRGALGTALTSQKMVKEWFEKENKDDEQNF